MAKHHAAIWWVLVAGSACGKASTPMDALHPGQGGAGGSGARAGARAAAGRWGRRTAPACPDFLGQTLQTFSIDISAADWAAIQSEFLTTGLLTDNDFVQHQAVAYPIVFHYGAETVERRDHPPARRLVLARGGRVRRRATARCSSGSRSTTSTRTRRFTESARSSSTCPARIPTFLRDRIANTWLRSIDIPAACSTSAQLMVNGSLYGVFVAEEHIGHHLLSEFFPGNSGGDLWDGGEIPQTNKSNPNPRGSRRSGTRRRPRRWRRSSTCRDR